MRVHGDGMSFTCSLCIFIDHCPLVLAYGEPEGFAMTWGCFRGSTSDIATVSRSQTCVWKRPPPSPFPYRKKLLYSKVKYLTNYDDIYGLVNIHHFQCLSRRTVLDETSDPGYVFVSHRAVRVSDDFSYITLRRRERRRRCKQESALNG